MYQNSDSPVDRFDVTWNYIYTGTPIALKKKVNERNFGSGLSTRLTVIPMPKTNFEMIGYEEEEVVDWERLEELRFTYNALYCLKPGEDYDTSKNVEPIVINSGYRSMALNRKVGGTPTSNHLTGCAVDIRCLGIEQALRYAVILMDYADETHQDFDELLIERSRAGNYWLHLAVRPKDNRRKTMFIQA